MLINPNEVALAIYTAQLFLVFNGFPFALYFATALHELSTPTETGQLFSLWRSLARFTSALAEARLSARKKRKARRRVNVNKMVIFPLGAS